jgi:hypothetical protein
VTTQTRPRTTLSASAVRLCVQSGSFMISPGKQRQLLEF